MKVAGFVNPLVHARGPCFNYGWVEALANLLQPLRRDAGCECMLIAGDWCADWARRSDKAQLLAGLHTVWIDGLALYRSIRARGDLPTALAQAAYRAEDGEHPALDVIAEVVARATGGFEPDIIIGFAGEANYLARLWPGALRLHMERSPFGRDPYPVSMYFDHLGTHGRSAIGKVGGLSLPYAVTSDGRALVRAFRAQMSAAFASLDPFRARDFRNGFDRLCLLPLQISNEFSFDAPVPYRTQFEYLYDFLAAAPGDVGVLVTEHPNAESVLRRSGPVANLDALRATFPNLISFDEFRQHPSPSQFLVPRVDGVWSVSSSVGHQALLFNCLLGSPPSTELANVASTTTLPDFFNRLGHCKSGNVDTDTFMAWLLERYLVPATLLTDGRWLYDYFRRRLDAARAALDPIDAFVPTADADRLIAAWSVKVPRTPAPASIWQQDPLVAELHAVQRERDAMIASTSWRLTAPLRRLKQAMDTAARFVHAGVPRTGDDSLPQRSRMRP